MKLSYYTSLQTKDLKAMTDEQLRTTLQNVAMHVNGRMAALERAGIENRSQAAMNFNKRWGNRISSKGVTKRSDLMKMIKAGTHFLDLKTSTVSGTRSFMRKVIDAVEGDLIDVEKIKEKELKKELSDLETIIHGRNKTLWDLVELLREDSYLKSLPSNELIQTAYEEIYWNKKLKNSTNKAKYEIALKKSAGRLINEANKYIPGTDIPTQSTEDLATVYSTR